MQALSVAWGKRVRERRRLLGMNQTDLAKKVGTGQPTISHIEHGKREPSHLMKYRIAWALETSVESLFPWIALRVDPAESKGEAA